MKDLCVKQRPTKLYSEVNKASLFHQVCTCGPCMVCEIWDRGFFLFLYLLGFDIIYGTL